MAIQLKVVHNSTTNLLQVNSSKEVMEQVIIQVTLQMVLVLLAIAIMDGATVVGVGRLLLPIKAIIRMKY